MTKSELVTSEIFTELFENYLNQRKNDLMEMEAEVVDKMYGGFVGFYQSCSSDEKKGVIAFLEAVIGDTASIILGGFDGATDLGELTEEFIVKYSGEEIQGSLQDDFLECVQNKTPRN